MGSVEEGGALSVTNDSGYRGTSLIRNTHHPRAKIRPQPKAYCKVLGGGIFL